jgi:nucleoid-associated protein YgaU
MGLFDKIKTAVATDDEEPAEQAQEVAKPVAATPAQPKLRTYTVVKGDTLSEIGQRFAVSWREIAKINHVKNPDLIYPGQVFTIPND